MNFPNTHSERSTCSSNYPPPPPNQEHSMPIDLQQNTWTFDQNSSVNNHQLTFHVGSQTQNSAKVSRTGRKAIASGSPRGVSDRTSPLNTTKPIEFSIGYAKNLIEEGKRRQGTNSVLDLDPKRDFELINHLKKCLENLNEQQQKYLSLHLLCLIDEEGVQKKEDQEHCKKLVEIKNGIDGENISFLDFNLLSRIVNTTLPN